MRLFLVQGQRKGSTIFFWKANGLTYKGFARQRLKSNKQIFTIHFHKGTSLKDKKNYCGYTFLARCPFDKNSADWHNPGN